MLEYGILLFKAIPVIIIGFVISHLFDHFSDAGALLVLLPKLKHPVISFLIGLQSQSCSSVFGVVGFQTLFQKIETFESDYSLVGTLVIIRLRIYQGWQRCVLSVQGFQIALLK
jgi:hypothetical protein